MDIHVRQMRLEETKVLINYFHDASAEHLEKLGVDPTRLPAPQDWWRHFVQEYKTPIEQRTIICVGWEIDGELLGFSTTNKITYGEHAYIHLHIVDPDNRKRGFGAECVKRSAKIYFDLLKLKRLFCEPNAFNVAPNRTLQKAGFKYLKTHKTVPSPLNYHQAVTRWVLELEDLQNL